ncbi:Cutinase transcription factor 1 beta [Exophiala dermatitidis]|uniref:Transcriptional regulatory protein AMDR n=1 Tax=Exophiala dermatitidis (strain ATCC 34100 / CBS 525.76 / NIH/UT8656) TaxID=858893 RepID=H6C9X5_EXODN|nr:transcriptional regulatory protein AMDR [Exophiala dermatitidis NIH/UT8656]EHY60786.1 transcriptional regulatory protein AMDR [Exophiala dermatitidis NIH/UT8656]KAJ9004747.1 hypothetical protein HRR94_000444 [Exophiala dermatitidis]
MDGKNGGTSTIPERKIKKRAGRACASCRARKVRCDVVRSGTPCTNCRLDSLECVVPKSRRHKVAKATKSNSAQLSSSAAAATSRTESVIVQSPAPDIRFAKSIPQTDRADSSHEYRLEHDSEGFPIQVADGAAPQLHLSGTAPDNIARNSSIEVPHGGCERLSHAARTPSSLPCFIKPLPEDLDDADIRYLHDKNAFELPSQPFIRDCLVGHLEFAHPLLPLLDKSQILSIINGPLGGDGIDDRETGQYAQPLSFLLFHAVLCSGVAFVETERIVAEGFESKQAARRAFFNRAKVLFDCNAEQDRFAAVQASVLLSTWYPGKKEKKDSWYWLGTAVSLAYSIGLHMDPDDGRFEPREQYLRRRLWWSVFVRENKIALALGRPARINYYNVNMLTPQDFEDDVVNTVDELDNELNGRIVAPPPTAQETHRVSRFQGGAVPDDHSMQDTLARLCIEHVKLCVCIADLVATIFNCRQQVESGECDDPDGRPLPSPSAQLKECAQNFARWYHALPPDLRYVAHDTSARSSNDHSNEEQDVMSQQQCCNQEGHRSLIVHKATVHVSYYVAISALYRLKALSPNSTWRDDRMGGGEPNDIPQRILRDAAWELTRVNQGLCDAGLIPYLSTSAVGSVVAAVVIHLLDVKAPNPSVRRAAVEGIQQCQRFLLILQEAYGTAADAIEYLREANKEEGVEMSASEGNGVRDRQYGRPETTVAGSNHPVFQEQHLAGTQSTAHWHEFDHGKHRHSRRQSLISEASHHTLRHKPHPEGGSVTLSTEAREDIQFSSFLPIPPIPEFDEMYWQSYVEGTPNFDLFAGFNLPQFDLGESPNDSGGFNIGDILSEY